MEMLNQKWKKRHCWIFEWDFGKKGSALLVLISGLTELHSCYVEKYPLFWEIHTGTGNHWTIMFVYLWLSLKSSREWGMRVRIKEQEQKEQIWQHLSHKYVCENASYCMLMICTLFKYMLSIYKHQNKCLPMLYIHFFVTKGKLI